MDFDTFRNWNKNKNLYNKTNSYKQFNVEEMRLNLLLNKNNIKKKKQENLLDIRHQIN